MNIVKISSKNQITIPKEVLESLGVESQSRLLLQKESGNIVLKPIKGSIVEELGGSLKKYTKPSMLGVPFSKIMEVTKKRVAKKLAEE